LVDTAKWNTIDFEWSRDKEKARFQSLQADNALSTESAGKKNKDGTWSDRSSHPGRLKREKKISKRDDFLELFYVLLTYVLLDLVNSLSRLDIFSGVITRCLHDSKKQRKKM
jgi:hypothetical protein